MRVGIIAYLLHEGAGYRAAGVSTYSRQLLAHLPVVAPQHEYLALSGQDAPLISGVRPVRAPFGTSRPALRIPWEQIAAPLQLRMHNASLVHGLVNVLPLLSRQPALVTVHDLAFLRHPERFSSAKAVYLRRATALSVSRARTIIAVSESTKRDLVELAHVPEQKVTVIYPGVDISFKPGPKAGSPVGRDRPYILHVGTLEPRKNLDVLIRAFKQVHQLGRPHALVLAGGRGWMYENLFRLVRELELENDVKFVGFVPPDELPAMYNGADLLAYPSVYEGFGLPVAEAMACGTPVITSSSSSLREVAGDAALTVTPGSVEELAMAMIELLGDERECERLRRAGFEQAARFTWLENARETVRFYERLA